MSPAELAQFEETKAFMLTIWLAMFGGLGVAAFCSIPLQMSLGRSILAGIAWEAVVFALFYAGAFH